MMSLTFLDYKKYLPRRWLYSWRSWSSHRATTTSTDYFRPWSGKAWPLRTRPQVAWPRYITPGPTHRETFKKPHKIQGSKHQMISPNLKILKIVGNAHESQWTSMNPKESKWTSMNLNESQWTSMNLNESQRIPLNLNEPQWIPMNLNEPQWIPMNRNESKWTSMNLSESQWTSVNPNESQWIPMNLSESQRIPDIFILPWWKHRAYLVHDALDGLICSGSPTCCDV